MKLSIILLTLLSINISYSLLISNNNNMICNSEKEKKDIVLNFLSRKFTPVKSFFGFASNCHYQTIVGSEALRTKILGNYPRYFKHKRERYMTPDNDFFDVDYAYPSSLVLPSLKENNSKYIGEDKGLVIILHGLESNTDGALVTKMATAFLHKGFSCALVSFRGCSGEDNCIPGAYHLGFTDDLNQLVRTLHDKEPNRRLYLSGFSLGGNVCLKYLGELGDEATELNLLGGAVTCVPFDPVASQGKLDVGINRAIYSENFLTTLKKKAQRKIERFPKSFDYDRIKKCKTIGEFDDHFIAKLYGFKDKFDYYRKTGSKWWLDKIRTPTVAINALDDPFIEESSLPAEQDVKSAPVRLIYHEKGGHCGFLAEDSNYNIPTWGFIAEELSRVIDHIHTHYN